MADTVQNPAVTISRSKIYPQPAHPGRAWNWLYKVDSPGEYSAEGTAHEIRYIAKRRAARLNLPIVDLTKKAVSA